MTSTTRSQSYPPRHAREVGLRWPDSFEVYGPYRADPDSRAALPFAAEALTKPPRELTVHDRSFTPREMSPDNELLDFGKAFGGFEEFNEVFVCSKVDCDQRCRLWVGLSGNWWMQWWINGRPICDTMHRGNRVPIAGPIDRVAPLPLEEGPNMLCGRVIAGDLGHAVLIAAPTTIQRYIDDARLDPAPIDDERARQGIATLSQRMRRLSIDAGDEGLADASVDDLVAALGPDDRWPDIDYEGYVGEAASMRAVWQPGRHLARLGGISRAIANTDQPDPKWIEAARRAFDHWIEKRYQCANWWFNRINTPGQMAEILFDLRPHLGAAEFEAGLDVVRQVTLDPHGLTAFGQQFHDWSTGANAMWVIERAIALGCLTDDPDLVTRAQLQLGRICHTSEGEGIKPDHSFHQHGAQFYPGGYGAAYARMAAKMAALLHGTPWALAQPRVATLSRFLLDGQQWLVCADRRNPSSGGRNIARKGDAAPGTGRAMVEPARSLVEVDRVNGAELREMLARFQTDGSTANPLVGNRCFWCSDVMVHRRPDFVASIRAVSQRTQSMESCNSENLRGVHLADGLVLQWRTGAEYDGIFPAWDWEMLPGVTCTHGKDNLVPKSVFGPTRFVGGASDGEFGLFAYDFRAVHEPRSLRGRKAWFCFDNCMVWLGAGIDCEDALAVLTTIDQRRLEGEVLAGPPQGLGAIDPGEHRIAGDRWLWHDRVAYAALDGRARMLRFGQQTGDWHAINPGRYRRPEPVSLPVFTRWVDHGVAPSNDGYAELVVFDVSTEQVPRLAETPPVRLLRNTAELQAVAHDRLDLTMAAFYAPGQLVLPDGRTLRVREPGLVMVRGGEIVALADPTHPPNQSPAPADQQVVLH